MAAKKQIWYGEIPGIFGCGLYVISESRAGAMKGLREGYRRWKEVQPDPDTNFKTSFDWWGGFVSRVELDRSYNDFPGRT